MVSNRLLGYWKNSARRLAVLALLGVVGTTAGAGGVANAQEPAPTAPVGPAGPQLPDENAGLTDQQLLDKAIAAAKRQDDAVELTVLKTLLGRYPDFQYPARPRKLPKATQALLDQASVMLLSLQAALDYYVKTGVRLRHIGGGVSAPVPIYQVQPKIPEEARRDHFSGFLIVNLIVDETGRPQDVHVLQPAGHGVDEAAIDAVKQYKFKPAMENGKPVLVMVNVEINIDAGGF